MNSAKKIFAAGSAVAMLLLGAAPVLAVAHTVGTNISSTDGTVWMIANGASGVCRRAYTSAGAFLSYGFNSWSQVVVANSDDLALPVCSEGFIPPQDGSVIFSDRGADKGTGFIVSGGMKYGFPTEAIFKGQGYSYSTAMWADMSWMATGGVVNAADAAHLPGTLINNNGTVQLVGNSGLLGVPDLATFNSWGYSFAKVVPANANDKAKAQTGVMAMRQPGQLSPTSMSTTPVTTGPISAMLAASNPASGVIVAGQATAPLLAVTLTGNGTVNSLVLHRSGISDQNTLSNVYLYDGATRLTDGYSFNSNGDLTMNNLGLVVSGSRTVWVQADVSSSASSGQTIAVALTSVTAAGSSASAVSVMGNTMTIASGSTLATASLSANTIGGTPTVNAGTSAYVFWSAPLQVNTRTLSLKSANFRMIGSAPADALSNIKMYIDGVDSGVAGVVTMANGSNYATFNFMNAPKSLTTGSHSMDVRADIQKGSNRNVQFSIQNASDLMIMDPQVGVNIAVGGTIPNNAATISIGTGSLTAVLDTGFQSLTNVTGGGSNTAIAKYKLHAYGEDVKIQSLQVLPVLSNACTSGTTYGSAPCNVNSGSSATQFANGNGLQNVTLYFNGSQVGTQTAWNSGNLTFQLGSQLIVPAGQDSTLEVRADVRTNGTLSGGPAAGQNYTAGTISANLVVGSSNAQGQSSFNTVSTPALTGNTLTIQTGLLAVSANTGYASQNQNPNTAGVKIGSYVFQNQSSSESVRVTNLAVTVAYGAGTSSTNLSALRTSETSGSGSVPVQPATAAASASGTNTFSVDFTLAPGATKVVDILADTSTNTGGTATVQTSLVVTSIGVSSNVSTTSSTITGQTITLQSGTVATPTLLTANSTTAQYIAAGNGGNMGGSTATFNFNAAGGAATISELKFTVTASAGTPVSSVTVGSTTAPVVAGVAWLTGLALAVPNGGSGLTQPVTVNYSEVSTSGVVPATTTNIGLTYVKYTSGGTTTTITPTVNAPTMTMVGSKPTVTVNGTQATGLILGAENKIGEVTVTADAKGNIKLNDIAFSVGSSNITTFAITAPRIADGTTTVTGSGCAANASVTTTVFCEFGTVGNTFATGAANAEVNNDFDGYTIQAGTSKTFSLYGVVGGTVTTAGGTTTVSTSITSGGFNWDDASYPVFVADASAASPANGTNLTGALIYNFPTNSYSIKQ